MNLSKQSCHFRPKNAIQDFVCVLAHARRIFAVRLRTLRTWIQLGPPRMQMQSRGRRDRVMCASAQTAVGKAVTIHPRREGRRFYTDCARSQSSVAGRASAVSPSL